MGYLYKITNKVDNKSYIGATIQHNYNDRWRKHINCLKYKEGCPLLKNAMKKYGTNQFEFKILIICFDDDVVKYEKEYIKKYNTLSPNGYNLLNGGQLGDGFVGHKHTTETIHKIKQKVREFRENNPNYFETYREKLKQSMMNVDRSYFIKNSEKFKKAMEERRKKYATMEKGKITSEETKKKISKGLKSYYQNNKGNIKNKQIEAIKIALSKPISQYTKDNILVKEYCSIAEAHRTSGVKKSNIQMVLSGKNKTAGGFIWKYIAKSE
jgi:group I intron endonuclease